MRDHDADGGADSRTDGATATASAAPGPVRRTPEIEDPTNAYVIHAIANRLTPVLARLHVHPNAVSTAGMAFGIGAGFAYFDGQDRRYAIAGFVLMIAWHVMDGVDGQLARLTNTQSDIGKVLDGVCDYVTFAAVYVALGIRLGQHHGHRVWAVVAIAGVCHAAQSAAFEMQRQTYDEWSRDPPPGGERQPAGTEARTRPSSRSMRLSGLLHGPYAQVQRLATGSTRTFDRDLRAVLQRQPERAACIRARYRRTFAPPIRRWSILSANYRTIGIFVAVMVRLPLYYFLFEIVGLSLVLAYLTVRQHARLARFLEVVQSRARA